MEIKFLKPAELTKEYINDMLDILVKCDKEFVPPLSSRNDTKQVNFKNCNKDSKPIEYLKKVLEQYNIFTIYNHKVIAFMSFINKHEKNENYITTICVSKEFRNKGIGTKMYDYIENNLPDDISCKYVSTRTWSTNEAQIKLLNERNYQIANIIKDDRNLENGRKIDTMYFRKEL